jgi:putative transposase
MARQARVVIPWLPHHITLRGNNKRRLFSYPREYAQFVYLMGRATALAGTQLHAAVLMTNHVHLIVTPPLAEALPRFAKHLMQRYAQERNKRRAASGKLFEARYFSKPILDEGQLAVTLAYVDLNPVRGGMASAPGDYRWSTYHCHASETDAGIPRGLVTETAWYRSLGTTEHERRSAYAEWTVGCLAKGEVPAEANKLKLRAALSALSTTPIDRRPDGKTAT